MCIGDTHWDSRSFCRNAEGSKNGDDPRGVDICRRGNIWEVKTLDRDNAHIPALDTEVVMVLPYCDMDGITSHSAFSGLGFWECLPEGSLPPLQHHLTHQ